MQPFLPPEIQGPSTLSAGIGPETYPTARGNSRKGVNLPLDLKKPFDRFARSNTGLVKACLHRETGFAKW
jgi:hypothetical protein